MLSEVVIGVECVNVMKVKAIAGANFQRGRGAKTCANGHVAANQSVDACSATPPLSRWIARPRIVVRSNVSWRGGSIVKLNSIVSLMKCRMTFSTLSGVARCDPG